MSRNRKRFRRAGLAGALVLGLAALTAVTAPPAWTDDRELLRVDIAKPYLFILVDTSASMNLKIGGQEPTDLFGDDPDSRLYAAKEALFKVFSDVENVHFGFATFNQDNARVVSKHWVYYSQTKPPGPSSWSISWPRHDPDTLTKPDKDDPTTPIKDIASGTDLLVFGRSYDDGAGTPLTAGSCFSPLNLTDTRQRRQINYFAKLGANSTETTTLWITEGGPTYQLQVLRDPDSTLEVGDDNLPVLFILNTVATCLGPDTATFVDLSEQTLTRTLRLDPFLREFLMIDGIPGGGAGATPVELSAASGPAPAGPGDKASIFPEEVPGFWNWADGLTDNDCAVSGPHTGGGWESNYDSGDKVGDPLIDPLVVDDDTFCDDPGDQPAAPDFLAGPTCVNIRPMKKPTVGSVFGRPLDRGDVIPLDWKNDNKLEFLRRLAPNYPVGTTDFRVSTHLTDDPGAVTNLLEPKIDGRPPIMGSGVSPLAEAILDFRCWYASENSNKCGMILNAPVFRDGWEDTACKYDTLFGCRRPFLIVISDGFNSCPGNDPTSEVASLRSKTGMQTWALNLGNEECQKTELGSLVQAGSGECIDVGNKDELVTTLEGILGTIESQARAFASAAVPTVQSNADQTLFLSSFRPLKDQGFWDGHLRNFQKPLPLDADGKPDVNDNSSTAGCAVVDPDDPDGCHLWDAGAVMADNQANNGDPLDLADGNKRRVFYSQRSTSGNWATKRRLLDPTNDGDDQAVRYDIWRGFAIIPEDTADGAFAFDPAFEDDLDLAVKDVIDETLALKSGTLGDNSVVPKYLLGDIFHSRPVIVDAPPNNFFFAQDLGADPAVIKQCLADDSGNVANRGYRCFLQRQINRRKVLLVGANDGMLHGFDIGQFDRGTGRFTTGTGREIFAYMPRAAMPTVRLVTETDKHRFSVDGSPSVGDVFIDPEFTAAGPQASERLWRTVAITGLREGGSAYFALDVTQPEPIEIDATLGFVPKAAGSAVPGCIDGTTSDPDCGPTKYPAALWEFTDSTDDSLLATPPDPPDPPILMDEDDNGAPDLGDAWSTANIGRIRICGGGECDPAEDPNDIRDVYVAVFGGGMDPFNKDWDPRDGGTAPALRGNWLYMVDIETGKVIYKRQLDGPAPADTAAVDTDQDGYLDRIYLGTLFGSLYRVDLTADDDGDLPELTPVQVSDLKDNDYDADRIVVDKNGDPTWVPVKIFDANFNGRTATDVPRAIYQAPSVFFVTQLGLYGVAVGTGDREDLTNNTPEGLDFQTGRFYVFVDESGLDPGPVLPMTEDNFLGIPLTDFSAQPNLLTTRGLGAKGWFLELRGKEKVVSQAFSLLGVTFFSSFIPNDGRSDGQVTECPADPKDVTQGITCSPTGDSFLFVTSTINAQPFLKDPDTDLASRYAKVTGAFVSDPFTEIGLSQSGDDDGGGGGPGGGGDPGDGGGATTTDDLTDDEKEVMEAIKALFPPNCRFTNQRVDVKLVRSDTRVQRIAPVPVCVIEKNWKEF